MSSESITERMQNAFHSFLEHVEEFYDKERHDIGEAVEHARERLHEVEDLTVEEIDEVSRHFVEHLTDIGEQASDLREGVRDAVQLDTMYITSGILERLIKVADKTTVGLMELNEQMAERIIDMESEETAHGQDDDREGD